VSGASGSGPALDDADVELVGRLAEALEASLVRLVRSSRPDWGFPLLVGMARLVALDETRRAGHWMFLDAFAADELVIPAQQILGRPTLQALDEARGDFAIVRARLAREWRTGWAFRRPTSLTRGKPAPPIEISGPPTPGVRCVWRWPGVPRDAVLAVPIILRSPPDEPPATPPGREHEEAYETEPVVSTATTSSRETASRRSSDDRRRLRIHASRCRRRGHPARTTRRLGGHAGRLHAQLHPGRLPSPSATRMPQPRRSRFRRTAWPRWLACIGRTTWPGYLRESNTLTSTLYWRNPADSAPVLHGRHDRAPPLLGDEL
jgi:hypothetical protein